MSKVITPTIGRKVWFFPSIATMAMRNMKCTTQDQAMDATVVYVWHDRMINIAAIDHQGNLHGITSVTLIQPGDDVPEGRDHCTWMPYQVNRSDQVDESHYGAMQSDPIDSQTRHDIPATVLPADHFSTTVTSLEQAIREAGADQAPRVTMQDIDASIASEHYFTALQGARMAALYYPVETGGVIYADAPAPHRPELGLLTFCVLVLRNGFTVTGESACASPANFNAEIGRRLARERAVDKVWPLLGYELRNQLFRDECLKAEEASSGA